MGVVMQIILLMFVLPFVESYVNSYKYPFAFQCRPGYSINSIRNMYSSSHKDRKYKFGCRKTPGLSSTSCRWSGNANSLHGSFLYQCPNRYALSGVISQWRRSHYDRQYQFYCCYLSGKRLTSCKFSCPSKVFRGTVNFSVPKGCVIRSAASLHSSSSKDRIWTYEICRSS